MRDQDLKSAAIDGFKGSFQLAGELVYGLVCTPIVVLNAFVHHKKASENPQFPSAPKEPCANSGVDR